MRANINLTVYENADYRQGFIWKTGPNETPVDLTGWSAEMQIRSSPVGDVILELTTDNGGIEIANQLTDKGRYDLVIPADDTDGICPDHRDMTAVYDLFLISDSGERRLHQYGHVTFVAAVTREVTT